MPISLRNKAGNRAWTLKEWIQGKPLGHPSHPLFVHYPIAFYSAVLVFDVMTRIEPNQALFLASTYLLIGAALATLLAVTTGLIDWWGMVRGSSKRRTATRHLLWQFTAAIFFQTTMVLRFPDRHVADEASIKMIVLGAIGYLVLIVGQYLGGVLVYEKGMRVNTGGTAREPDERPPRA
ncbi:MAG: DUF2231 domain-containing protein [Actinomycetota bacterium]